VAVFVAAVFIILAGGTAVASNMGYECNKGLWPPNAAKPGAGDNWISIPYYRPYATYADLCQQLGLPNISTVVLQVNPQTGTPQMCTCGTAACSTLRLDLSNLSGPQLPCGELGDYLGIRIRSNTFVAGTSSAIIIGSHNPVQQVRLRAIPSTTCGPGNPTIGTTWVSVPYNTTAMTAQDLCVQLGLPPGPSATITRVDPVNGNQPPVTCNTAAAAALKLVACEAVKVRRTSAGPCTCIVSILRYF